MIDLNEVGAHIDGAGNVRFGVYLPQITAAKGYAVVARVIHEADQFTPEVPPRDFPLSFDPDHPLGLWSATVNVPSQPAGAGHFGSPGRYLYRYRLLRQQNVVTSFFTGRGAMFSAGSTVMRSRTGASFGVRGVPAAIQRRRIS